MPVRDRLNEFQNHVDQYNYCQIAENDADHADNFHRSLIMNVGDISQYDKMRQEKLNEYLDQVQDLQDDLRMLETYVIDLHYKHSQIAISADGNKQLQTDVDDIMNAFKTLSEATTIRIEDLKHLYNQTRRDRKLIKSHSVVLRIFKLHHAILSQKLHAILNKYSDEQVWFREQCKQRITDFLNLTNVHASADEIDDMIERGEFSKNILVDHSKMKVLFEVNSRRDDILKLEKNIDELHSLFTEVSLLISQQSEFVNSIERNVIDAREYVLEAEKEISKAKKYNDAYRKKKLLCLLCVCCVIIVIVTIIAAYLCLEMFTCF